MIPDEERNPQEEAVPVEIEPVTPSEEPTKSGFHRDGPPDEAENLTGRTAPIAGPEHRIGKYDSVKVVIP